MERVILTTGGTGGHIFPALSVAEELRRRYPGVRMLFVGSVYGPERQWAEMAGIPFQGLKVRGFLGRGLKSFGAALRMCAALCEALRLVWRFRPQIIAGFGGYASFAPMLAGRLCGVPCLLHEQNAVAGTANRLMGRFAETICLSLPQTQGFCGKKCVMTGNPIRAAIGTMRMKRAEADTRRLLVMGGSQGAHALNMFLTGILPRLREAGVEILHQSGRADAAATRQAYVAAGYSPECVTAFIDDMPAAYAWADLAVCRAGASTIAELCAAGLPAVLVPFPHAVHDHQTCNARVASAAGGAVLLPERELGTENAGRLILELLSDGARRRSMAAAARKIAQPDAAANVIAAMAKTLSAKR